MMFHMYIKKELERMNPNLKISFSRIKHDIGNLSDWVCYLNTRFTEQEKLNKRFGKAIAALQRTQSDIDALKRSLKKEIMQEISKQLQRQEKKGAMFGKRSVKDTERSVSVHRTPNTKLTPLHIEMLKRLMALQMENNARGVSMRQLASELYPDKEYHKIKSTLSEYLKKLYHAGLIEKIRRGRLYLSYTKKALEYADKARLKRMEELISRPW